MGVNITMPWFDRETYKHTTDVLLHSLKFLLDQHKWRKLVEHALLKKILRVYIIPVQQNPYFFSTVYVNVSQLHLNYTHTIQILVKMLVTIIRQITHVKVPEYTIVDENTQKINYYGVN